MASVRIAVTIDKDLLIGLDRLVKENQFPNRSHAVQEAVRDKLARLKRMRLARECAKLDRAAEQALAEEGFTEDAKLWSASASDWATCRPKN